MIHINWSYMCHICHIYDGSTYMVWVWVFHISLIYDAKVNCVHIWVLYASYASYMGSPVGGRWPLALPVAGYVRIRHPRSTRSTHLRTQPSYRFGWASGGVFARSRPPAGRVAKPPSSNRRPACRARFKLRTDSARPSAPIFANLNPRKL